jgi:DNA repair exonuclease SbcCD nuclease subunit
LSRKIARILLVADTHLGFDLPFRPRIERRRRGPDFFANFEAALDRALRHEVDVVVHAGDLFYRSRVPTALVQMAMEPMVRVANAGVPVLIVPGNHERSQIPNHLWGVHPGVHIFDRPRTYEFNIHGLNLAFSGFPFTRKIRDKFPSLVEDTGFKDVGADVHLLCLHQTVEGAKVGTVNYTFRSGPDVIKGADIPRGFAIVLGGHIHRSQVLRNDLRGRELAAPVVYPGSVERTSFAERDEAKHFVIVQIADTGAIGGELVDISFMPLPARPMVNLAINPEEMDEAKMSGHLRQRFLELDPDSVVRVQVEGEVPDSCRKILTAPYLRNLAPPSMNVSMAIHWQVKKASR